MTESPVSDGTGPAAALSAGALLRAARERQGLHIAALAAAIKVSPKKLEALEADRWSELPDATFTRALAQTVCRTLKIDARAVLDKLPQVGGVNLTLTLPSDTETGGAPARASAVTPERARAGVPALAWGALLLLVGAGVLVVLPSGWTLRPAAPVAGAASAANPSPGIAVATGGPATAASTAIAPSPAASGAIDAAASAPATAAPGSTVAAAPSPMPGPTTAPVASPLAAPTAPATAPPAVATPGPGALVLTATQDSWIEVRDANGSLLVSRLLAAGERMGLDGTPPLRATIGNAAGTQLSWRGQSIDIASRQVGNVARVDLP